MRDETAQAKTEKQTGNVVGRAAVRGADPDTGERRHGLRGVPGSQTVPAVHADVGSKGTVLDAGNHSPERTGVCI